jgi:hypothetical protein
MGDGTRENPFTSEDVIELVAGNGDNAQGLDLSGKYFIGGIDLSGLDLEGVNARGIVLNTAILKGIVIDNSHLEGIRLIGANLEGAYLENAHLESANLSGANLVNTHFVGAYLEKAQLTAAHLEGAEFFDAHLEEANLINTFLDKTRLSGAHLKKVKMVGAKFTTNTEMASIDWGDYILSEEKEGEKQTQRASIKSAEEIYRKLKIWYTEHGIYDVAGEFYYREMEAKRKAQSWKKETTSKLWSWVIRLLCGYGERYGNVVVAALVIIFGLAMVYVYSGQNLADAIYFSAVSFSALGYGGWVSTPLSWVWGVGVAESFLGVFMMALFITTFTRKMTR